MKFFPLVLIGGLICSGCASGSRSKPESKFAHVAFTSEPPGASIYVAAGANKGMSQAWEFVGKTPCDADCQHANLAREIQPRGIYIYSWVVRPVLAYRADLAERSITNYYKAAALGQRGDKLPDKIHFDFTR